MADDLGGGLPQVIIGQEPARDSQKAHLVIEDGDGGRRLIGDVANGINTGNVSTFPPIPTAR
jgi:hypothetical protein